MTTLTRITVLPLLASLSVVALMAAPAVASHPQALLVAPEPEYSLPKFGFASFNIQGVGERVTFVQWGGLASQLGLEPGDVILSMNGFPLSYHGSWSDALYHAMANGGSVRLRIRDVRTGHVTHRRTFVGGGIGPITPKVYAGEYLGPHTGPHTPHIVHPGHGGGHPYGPITVKSKAGHGHKGHKHNVNQTIKQIAKLFDKD